MKKNDSNKTQPFQNSYRNRFEIESFQRDFREYQKTFVFLQVALFDIPKCLTLWIATKRFPKPRKFLPDLGIAKITFYFVNNVKQGAVIIFNKRFPFFLSIFVFVEVFPKHIQGEGSLKKYERLQEVYSGHSNLSIDNDFEENTFYPWGAVADLCQSCTKFYATFAVQPQLMRENAN